MLLAAPWNADDYPPIHYLMGRILAELPAIGKDQENTQQHFKFRGIDQVLDALNPLMGRYGVFCVPHRVVELTNTTDRKSNADKTVYATYLTMQYRFYGPRGDYVEAVGIGEGTDSLDKATPKAMTGAYKYMLFESFSIATKEVAEVDADRGSSVGETTAVTPELADAIERFWRLPEGWQAKVIDIAWEKIWLNEGDRPTGNLFRTIPSAWIPHLEKWVSTAEARAEAERQDADAEAGQGPPPASRPAESVPVATPAATPPAVAEPAPEPDPDPDPTPDSEPSSDEPSTENGDEAEDPEAETTWEDVVKMSGTELADALKEVGAAQHAVKAKVEERRNYYWLAIGGEFRDAPFPTGWGCPFCNEFEFTSQDELTTHMEETHSGDEDEFLDDNAESGTATDSATPPDEPPAPPAPPADDAPTVDEATLAVVRESISALKGGNARAYAEYRRTKGLPAKPDNLSMDQAFELIDFIESLPK